MSIRAFARRPAFLIAAPLVLVLAACDGNDIPPPDPEPQVEGMVEPDDPPPAAGVSGQGIASPTQNPDDAVASQDVEEEFADVTAEAESRAQEIFDEVVSSDAPEPGQNQEIADLAPDPAPMEPSQADGANQTMGSRFAGILPADTLLAPETLEAVEYAQSASAPAYAGVWAPRAEDCELIDQQGFTDYAVIGEQFMTVDGQQCAITPGPLQSGTATVEGTCQVGGTQTPSSFTVSLSSAGDLMVTEPALGIDGRYVRCERP